MFHRYRVLFGLLLAAAAVGFVCILLCGCGEGRTIRTAESAPAKLAELTHALDASNRDLDAERRSAVAAKRDAEARIRAIDEEKRERERAWLRRVLLGVLIACGAIFLLAVAVLFVPALAAFRHIAGSVAVGALGCGCAAWFLRWAVPYMPIIVGVLAVLGAIWWLRAHHSQVVAAMKEPPRA